MFATIEIVREQGNGKPTRYRALRGEREAIGETPGQALDLLEQTFGEMEEDESRAKENLVVILQRFEPDSFFTAEQRARLQALMKRFHETANADQELAPDEQEELEQLIEAELQAAAQRAAAMAHSLKSSASE